MKWLTRVGLGALTIGMGGMAWGQGSDYNDIPAPDLYGDITGCESSSPMSVLAPALFGPNAGKSTLDLALEDGTMALPGTIVAGMLTPCAVNTNSVSQGIGQARILYREADQARRAAMIEGASDDAMDDYTEAKADKEAYGGAVYDKVYTESAANAVAAKAIRDYNGLFAVDDTNTNDVNEAGVYTRAVTDFDALVINNLDTATDMNVEDYVNTYGRDGIRGFQAIAGLDTAAVTAYDPTTETSFAWGSAFDASGKLTFAQNDAMAVRDQAGTITTYNNGADGSTDIDTLGELKEHLDGWNALVRATDKAVADTDPNTANPAVVAKFTRDAARAKVARDHVQSEWERLSAVVRRVDREPADSTSDSDKLDAYAAALRAVSRHGSSVRTTIGSLESATKSLSDSLTSADDFLAQVVSSAKYSQSQLDDDATDREVAAAALAVTNAEAALQAHMTLTGNADNPAVALLDALLKPDQVRGADNPEDDDGQALINAISDTYTAAENAATTAGNADTMATTAANAVAALTAMDDPETEDDETGAVVANTNAIAGISTSLEGLTGEEGQVGQNSTDIESLDGRVTTNEEALVDHGNKLAAKKMYIETLAAEIGVDPVTGMGTGENGMSRIDMNAAGVEANAGDIAMNTGNISMNADNIAMNAGNISTNADNIAANAGYIMTNATAIADEATARMAADTMLMGHVTTNSENIAANAGNIMANAGNIAANASEIMTNAGAIAANNMYIMENAGNIGQNSSMIGANAGAIAANASAISANGSRIDANAMAVRELREDMSGGIAAAMALAGMPEIGDRGFSVGGGSYDGESAIAVGVHFSGETSRFKAALTSGGGETGVSVGGGWSF